MEDRWSSLRPPLETWGIPAVVLGVVVFFFLTDRPSQAGWLAEDERAALVAQLDAEATSGVSWVRS